MAHPFATIPLGFSVMGRATLWWGGCAWDAFALPHLLPDELAVLVATWLLAEPRWVRAESAQTIVVVLDPAWTPGAMDATAESM